MGDNVYNVSHNKVKGFTHTAVLIGTHFISIDKLHPLFRFGLIKKLRRHATKEATKEAEGKGGDGASDFDALPPLACSVYEWATGEEVLMHFTHFFEAPTSAGAAAPAAPAVEDGAIDDFTNDSAMMIAYERSLETQRPDALFKDPLSATLAGSKGKSLSCNFEAMSSMFGFAEWRAFHKTWVAVRTRFIDDRVAEYAAGGSLSQLVNLGAGMDTRPYRLESCAAFANGTFDVDMPEVNLPRARIFGKLLGAPPPHCAVTTVDLDFLDKNKTLATELGQAGSGFDAAAPSLFIAEGLVMYVTLNIYIIFSVATHIYTEK